MSFIPFYHLKNGRYGYRQKRSLIILLSISILYPFFQINFFSIFNKLIIYYRKVFSVSPKRNVFSVVTQEKYRFFYKYVSRTA